MSRCADPIPGLARPYRLGPYLGFSRSIAFWRERGFAASIEGGYPIPLVSWLTFEPQIQGIWQRTSFDDTLDPFSTISFDRSDVFTGRVGALLRGTFGSTGAVWQPYLKGNVWWGSNGFDTVTFDGVGIQTGRNGGTTLEGGPRLERAEFGFAKPGRVRQHGIEHRHPRAGHHRQLSLFPSHVAWAAAYGKLPRSC